MAAHQVRALLMGGQACVFYGGAEFSRDTDLAVLAEPDNWQRLLSALEELQAENIAVPACEIEYLWRGHALHFRCHHPEAEAMRVDVLAVMRGVDAFPVLWERRVSLADADGTVYELLSLADLVRSKKTQRGKDWPMIQRLLEADYLRSRAEPTADQIDFWLRELRTPELLVEFAPRFPQRCQELWVERPLLQHAAAGNLEELTTGLEEEERQEREEDRRYWQPLKAELEAWRHLRI